jgi:thymidylate kinase
MEIISISGLDGSGKTTQTELLRKHFESIGKKVHYFHAIDFSIAQKIKKLLTLKKSSNAVEKSVVLASNIKIFLRKIAFLIDTIRFRFLKQKLRRQEYEYIITDRFFYDSIINIAYLMHKNHPPFIEKYMPVADFAFYLKMEPGEIMKRSRIPDQGLEYLESKKKLYDICAQEWNFKIIDANATQEQILKEILEIVNHEKNLNE